MAPLTTKPLTPDFSASRILRASIFGIVASVLIVGLLINLVSFIWNDFAGPALGRENSYNADPLFVGPTMALVAGMFAYYLWKGSQTPERQRVRDPDEGQWSEPTTHAEEHARRRFDPNPTAGDRPRVTGPTGPSGHGAPTDGWDAQKLP